jgi:hypothetical protein
MLREWQSVRQIPEEGFRRWFTDQNFDLIVWYPDESQSEISGFQLCYDKAGKERALTWKKGEGYLHNRIDDGEIPQGTKRSPILVADGAFSRDRVRDQFVKSSSHVESGIVNFVVAMLNRLDRPLPG